MKLLLTTLLLLFAILQADDLPNTGLQLYEGEFNTFLEGNYYYGEGVTFGGIPVVGEWSACVSWGMKLDVNGSAISGDVNGGNPVYFVNEASTELVVFTNHDNATYYIREYGNNGCLGVQYSYAGDISAGSNSCEICKTTYNAKTYGNNSNRVNIWVGN